MKRTILVRVENHSGMLSKVSGLFSRRAFNIHSLAVGVTENPEVSCMTIVVDGGNGMIEQVEKQLAKLVGVISVKVLEEGGFISGELVFIKVPAGNDTRSSIIEIAGIYGAKVAGLSPSSIILEYTGYEDQIENILNMLYSYGTVEVVRTGTIAIEGSEI